MIRTADCIRVKIRKIKVDTESLACLNLKEMSSLMMRSCAAIVTEEFPEKVICAVADSCMGQERFIFLVMSSQLKSQSAMETVAFVMETGSLPQ